MPGGPTEGDGWVDREGDHDGIDLSEAADGLDESVLPGYDYESDRAGGGADSGTGLTEPERELADELDRTRALEATRDRFERFAGNGAMGGGRGTGSSVDRDALAIIDAAGRFGLDDDEETEKERLAISDALAAAALAPPKKLDEYTFYAIVAEQKTRGNNILLTMKVPWEHREEVFRAMETMPFAAMVRMNEVRPYE